MHNLNAAAVGSAGVATRDFPLWGGARRQSVRAPLRRAEVRVRAMP